MKSKSTSEPKILYKKKKPELLSIINTKKIDVKDLEKYENHLLAEGLYMEISAEQEAAAKSFQNKENMIINPSNVINCVFPEFTKITKEFIQKFNTFDTLAISELHIVVIPDIDLLDEEEQKVLMKCFDVFTARKKGKHVLYKIFGLDFSVYNREKENKKHNFLIEDNQMFLDYLTIGDIVYPGDTFDYFKKRSFEVLFIKDIKPVIETLGCSQRKIYNKGILITYPEKIVEVPAEIAES